MMIHKESGVAFSVLAIDTFASQGRVENKGGDLRSGVQNPITFALEQYRHPPTLV